MSLEPGSEIGPYRVIERAGRGGMASVYKAHQPALGRYVAVKVLPDYLADDSDFRERFQAEAMAVASLRHPNIPAIFDYGESNGITYIVSDYIDGGMLSEQMGKPLPLDYILRILRPVASALDYAHSRGVLHRDIKPSNVLLTRDGQPMLNDFGLARMMETEVRITQSPTVMGTPQYMAPEQCEGGDVGPAADIYSFGVMAYEMLTGQVPFSAPTPAAVLMAQIRDPLPPPRSINPALAEGIESALLKALAKNPADRYRSASGFLEALEAGGRETPSTGGASPGGDSTVRPQPLGPAGGSRRTPLIIGGAVLLLLLVVGVGGYLMTRGGNGVGPIGGLPLGNSPAAAEFGTPWTPGPKMTQGTQSPRGPLAGAAKLSGDASDFEAPTITGDESAVKLEAGQGYYDVAIVKPDGHVRFAAVGEPHDHYVIETELAIRPGSHFTARWIYRRGDGTQGDQVVALDSDRGAAVLQYILPPAMTPEGQDVEENAELFKGNVFVLTAETAADGNTNVYVNQVQIANFTDDRGTDLSGPAFEVFGQAGELRILGLRGYSPA